MKTKKLSACQLIIAALLLSLAATPTRAQLFEKGLNLLKKEAKKEVNKATNGQAGKLTRTAPKGIKRTPGKNYYTDNAWHEAVAKRNAEMTFKYDTISNIIYKLDPRNGTACLYGVEDVMKHEMKEVTVLGHVRYKGRSYTVTEIAGESLASEPLLTKVILPPTIKEIGPKALAYNQKLTDIIIPSSVQIIKNCAFASSGLKTVKLNTGLKTIEGMAFAGCKLTSIVIPNSVTDIQTYAFLNCENLTQVTLPKGIKEIKAHLFQNCKSLKYIDIPEGVTAIRDAAFWQCYSLETVKFPSTLKLIEDDVFSDCKKLKTPMPAGVKVESFFDD